MIVVGVVFIMREIELAYAQVQHVQLDDVNLKVSHRLPVSKRDYRALGCTRTLACLCQTDGSVRADCAYHAVVAQVQLLHDHFGQAFPDGLTLFSTAAGEHVSKAIVVRLLVDTVRGYGGEVTTESGTNLLGGHSFRVSGAQRLAALEVEVTKIMVLARWTHQAPQ